MRKILILLTPALFSTLSAQTPPPAPAPAPTRGPIITWEDANDQDYYGYNGYYYGGGYYGYGGGYGGRGRIVVTTVGQIALGEVVVEGADVASLPGL
jgi:hypothetical protein